MAALTDVGVTVPWVFVLYRATFRPGWSAAVPGLWLGLLVYAAAALWESGDRATEAAPRHHLIPLLIGLAGAYAIAYGTMPAALHSGILSWNPAVGDLPAAGLLWFLGARSVTEGVSAFFLVPRYLFQLCITALCLRPAAG